MNDQTQIEQQFGACITVLAQRELADQHDAAASGSAAASFVQCGTVELGARYDPASFFLQHTLGRGVLCARYVIAHDVVGPSRHAHWLVSDTWHVAALAHLSLPRIRTSPAIIFTTHFNKSNLLADPSNCIELLTLDCRRRWFNGWQLPRASTAARVTHRV